MKTGKRMYMGIDVFQVVMPLVDHEEVTAGIWVDADYRTHDLIYRHFDSVLT